MNEHRETSRNRSSVFSIEAVLSAGIAAAVVVAFVGWPTDASACGGFFCNQRQPVNQADENIVFSVNDDGTVSALIQIQYQGPAEEFAWLLPVYGKPDVDVSSSTVFRRLTRSTAPSYNRNVTVKGECAQPEFARSPGAGGADASAAADAGADDGGVNEIKKGSVGPYNFTVISVDKKADDPAKQALEWLKSNGYDLTDIGPDLVRDYLKDNMNLIAFKLKKQAQSGDIRPVDLTYDHPLPMIPLKLTAVAAQEDMGIRVWVGGDARAVPTEFDLIELNPAAINWFNWGRNYEQVVSQAADEVGGRGFVTEFAGKANEAENAVFTESNADQWQSYNEPSNWAGREGELLYDTVQNYWPRFGGSQWDGMPVVVRNEVPLPEGVTAREFLQRPRQVEAFGPRTTDIDGFEPESYLSSLEKHVVAPVRDAEEMIQKHPYLTRMFTTVSPGEMTRDPTFEVKEGMPDVSRTHTAEQTIYCSSDVTQRRAPWKMELPDGTTVWGDGRNWPFQPGDIEAAKTATDYGMTGAGEVVEDNTESIDRKVESHNEEAKQNAQSGGGGGTGGQSETCAMTRSAPLPVGALSILALGLLGMRRRRDE